MSGAISSMREVLHRQLRRTYAKLPKNTVSHEKFNQKLCARCSKPCDLAQYFGKRKYPYAYCKACHAAYMREWRKRNPLTDEQKRKDNCRSYAGRYLNAYGKLKRAPCKMCGSPESQMHHPDYDKPLEVEWMCRPCHLLEHHIERTRAALTSS